MPLLDDRELDDLDDKVEEEVEEEVDEERADDKEMVDRREEWSMCAEERLVVHSDRLDRVEADDEHDDDEWLRISC